MAGSPFYQYGSGSGNASPHGYLPLSFSRSAICIQTGQRAQVVNHPDWIIGYRFEPCRVQRSQIRDSVRFT